MKSVVASIGMFAAMANAYQAPHHQHMHFRRDNGTDSGLTTLTVVATQVHTVTSCAPTVTNCPSRDQTAIDALPESDKTTYAVTNTVVLTETVCPVTEADAISSSIVQEAQTGDITGKTLSASVTVSVPLTTGGSYPPVTDGDSLPEATSLTTITSDIVTEKTLTLTLGTGEDASTVTTTVQATIQTTITVPCDEVTATDDGLKGNGISSEPTTTTTRTSTGTVTKTVEHADTTETKTYGEGDDGKSTGNGSDGSYSDNGECPEPKTVTVTAPASTVYVTVGSDASQTESPDASVTGKADDGESDNSSGNGEDNDEDSEDDDEEEYCDETSTVEATVTVVPYPVNTTIPKSGYARPTGFARRLR